MRNARRIATASTLVLLLCSGTAWAQDGSFMTVWGVFHVGISLGGTVLLLWLLRRGVEKL